LMGRRHPTPMEAPRGFDLKALYRSLDEGAIGALRQMRLDGGWDSFIPLEDESKYTPSLIERLKQADLIEWSVGDRALRCPRCLSRDVRVFYVCPYCKSRDVSKGTLHAHHSCGAFFTEPVVRGKAMYCPNCGAELKEGDHSVVGAWFKCESCDRGFENPDIGFKCGNCMLDFDIQASRYDKVLSARLTDKAKLLLTALDILDSVSREASRRGYEVRLFSTIRGVSGVEHDFDAVLARGDRLVAVAVLPEGAWLLVTCKMQLDADVQRLLGRYRLKLAQGSSMEEVSASIARCLDDLEGLRVA